MFGLRLFACAWNETSQRRCRLDWTIMFANRRLFDLFTLYLWGFFTSYWFLYVNILLSVHKLEDKLILYDLINDFTLYAQKFKDLFSYFSLFHYLMYQKCFSGSNICLQCSGFKFIVFLNNLIKMYLKKFKRNLAEILCQPIWGISAYIQLLITPMHSLRFST